MANSGTVGSLYVSLGLDTSELESGFIAVDRSVSQNMARLNRESNLIRLRAEVEIGNLDETADATQILTIRETALNRQMQIQRDRIRLTEASLRQLTQQHGASAAVTQRMATQLERERLALQRLQGSLDELHENTENTGNSFENLTDVLSNGKFGAVAAGITAIAGALKTVADSSVELIEKFRELQKQSYDLNMSFPDTKKFLRQLRLGGGEYGDFEGYIRGITDAYVKGEVDDPEFIALSRYGAQITDATGRLKDFKDITEEVYQAYERAKAEGNEIEFLQLTGGEAGVRDAKQFFDRYKESKEDAEKVFDSGINPAELHESERALNLLTEQTGEFKDSLIDIFTPATKVAMASMFEFFRDSTQFIVENKDELQRWGLIAVETFDTVLKSAKELNADDKFQIFKSAFNFVGENILPSGIIKNVLGSTAKNIFGDTWASIVERAKQKQNEYNQSVENSAENIGDFGDSVEDTGKVLSQYGIQRVKQFQDELEDLHIELDFGGSEYDKGIAETDLWLQRELNDKLYVSLEEELAIRELYSAKIEQIEREKEERVEEIREQVAQSRRTDLENALAEIEEEKQKRIDAGMKAAEAIQLAAEESAATISELEDAFTEKVNNFRNNALQNKLDSIDKDTANWIKKGITPEQANAFGEEQKNKAYQDLQDDFSKRLNEVRGNDLENQLARIEEEKQAWIQKGIDEVQAEELANAQKTKLLDDYSKKQEQAQQKAAEQAQGKWERVGESIEEQYNNAMSVLKSQLEEFKAFRGGGIKGLEEYQRAQLKKQGITDDDLKSMTTSALANFQQAQKDIKGNLLPNFKPQEIWKYTPPQFDNFNNSLDKSKSTIDIATVAVSDAAKAVGDFTQSFNNVTYEKPLSELINLPNMQNLPNGLSLTTSSEKDYFDGTGGAIDSTANGLNTISQSFFDKFSSMYNNFSDIFASREPNHLSSPKVPQPININVNMDNIHAWDTEHIQEVADKVANVITPEIERAIGGDSNSY